MQAPFDINWNFAVKKVSDLKDWELNPRKISETEYKKLVDDIRKYGFNEVLKIDTDNTIISGHQRRKALLELGREEVMVAIPDRALTAEERVAIALLSNKHRGRDDMEKILGNPDSFSIPTLLAVGFNPLELGKKTVSFEVDESKKCECPTCGKKHKRKG